MGVITDSLVSTCTMEKKDSTNVTNSHSHQSHSERNHLFQLIKPASPLLPWIVIKNLTCSRPHLALGSSRWAALPPQSPTQIDTPITPNSIPEVNSASYQINELNHLRCNKISFQLGGGISVSLPWLNYSFRNMRGDEVGAQYCCSTVIRQPSVELEPCVLTYITCAEESLD